MEISSAQWLQELDGEDFTLINHPEMNPQEQLYPQPIASVGGRDFEYSLSIEDYAPWSTSQENTRSSIGGGAAEPSDKLKKLTPPRRFESLTLEENGRSKQPCNQNNAIAEKMRREKLNQHFIALSRIIPGLKKIDKASLLGDAINYVKELEAKVKTLEEKVENTIKPLISTKKSCHPIVNNISTDFDEPSCEPILKIEAKLTGRTVLMRIYCEKRKGILVKVFSEVEKLHLSITSSNSLCFQGSFHNIHITAEIEEGFTLTVNDLEKNLNSAFIQFV